MKTIVFVLIFTFITTISKREDYVMATAFPNISNSLNYFQAINQICKAINEQSSSNTINVPCSMASFSICVLRSMGIHNSKFATENGVVCQLPKIKRIKQNVLHSGMYRVARPIVLDGLADLLIFWECHTKTTLFILDHNSGFFPSTILQMFKSRPDINCRTDFITFSTKVNDMCSLIQNYRYIVLIGDEESAKKIMTHANCSELYSTFHTWLIVSSKIPNFLNAEEFRNYINPMQSQVTVLIPQSIKQMTITKQPIKVSYSPSIYCQTYKHQIETANISISINEEMSLEYERAEELHILDVFYSNQTKHVEVIMFAKWTLKNRLYYLHKLQKKDIKNHMLRGRKIRLTTIESVPYTILNTNKTEIIDGALYDLYRTLQYHFNVHHLAEVPKNHTYGMDINGSLTGFLGVLQRGEADVAWSVAAARLFRKKAVHFGTTTYRGCVQMVIKRPIATVPLTVYVQSFQPNVWMTTLSGILLLLFILAIATTFSPYNAHIISNFKNNNRIFYWFVSGEFLALAFEKPLGCAVKIILCTLLMATLTVFVYYCSIFTSILAYRELKLPFNTLEEMAVNKEYKLLIVGGTYIQATIENAKDEVLKKVNEKFISEGAKEMVDSFPEGMQKTLADKYVFISEGPSAKALSKGSCQWLIPSAKFLIEYFYMTFRKDFPYWKLYSNSFIQLNEGGVINRQQRIYLTEPPSDCDNFGSLTLGLNHVLTLFILLGIAFFIAMVAVCVENIYHN